MKDRTTEGTKGTEPLEQIVTTLADILTNGRIGSLELGLARADATRIMGEPPDWAGSDHAHKAGIWKYRMLQIAFTPENTVWYYHFQFDPFAGSDEAALPPNIRIEGYVPSGKSTKREVAEFLTQHGIGYKQDTGLALPRSIWVINPQTTIVFDDEGHLDSVFISSQ